MGLSIQWDTVLFFAVGLGLLYGLGWLLMMPVRRIMKFVLNGVLGGALLVLINMFSEALGFTVAINAFTCILTGFLGVPGVILLAAISWLF